MNKFKFQFHSDYIYNIKLPLLIDMNHGYMARLKLAVIKSVPDISNSECTEYSAFKHPVRTLLLLNQHIFILPPNCSLSCTVTNIIIIIVIIIIMLTKFNTSLYKCKHGLVQKGYSVDVAA
jgi:hypothetical protein